MTSITIKLNEPAMTLEVAATPGEYPCLELIKIGHSDQRYFIENLLIQGSPEQFQQIADIIYKAFPKTDSTPELIEKAS